MDDLTRASARELAGAVRRGQVSARELVDAHLDRIAAVNPELNAVVQLISTTARAEAAAADKAAASGDELGPLHGLPFTVKDWIETAGVVCAAGEEKRRDFVPARDATVVARMRSAGAILLGKTNLHHDNPVYGPTRNPYDTARTAGFSSSGEAAIIAAGGSPVGLGSDSGGSIRQPAHCCGIAGLRPSAGRVPLTGHHPAINALSDPRTVIGPMARRVDDLAMTLPIISGMDFRDAAVVPVPLGDYGTVGIDGLRVAFYADDGIAPPTPETSDAVAAVAARLADAGLLVTERRPDGLEESIEITKTYWARPESSSWDEWVPDGQAGLSGEEVERSLFHWDRFRRQMLGFIEDYDAILSPAAPRPAPQHPAAESGVSYLVPWSLTGWPAVVVRGGTSPEGLPIGVQIVAGPWRDDVALAVAGLVEQISGGYRPPPT